MGIEQDSYKRRLEMVKSLTLSYIVLDEQRVENVNRIQNVSGMRSQDEIDCMDVLYKSFTQPLDAIKSKADAMLKPIAFWNYFLSYVKEIPAIYLLALITGIRNIKHFEIPSDLWEFCGLHTYEVDESGKRWFKNQREAEYFISGILNSTPEFKGMEQTNRYKKEFQERLQLCVSGDNYKLIKIAAKSSPKKLRNWDMFFRTVVWHIGHSIDKSDGFYNQQLKKIERIEIKKRENKYLSREVIRKLALRLVSKLVLIHIVQNWQQMEGRVVKRPIDDTNLVDYPGFKIIYSDV